MKTIFPSKMMTLSTVLYRRATGHLKTGSLLSFLKAAAIVFKDEEKPTQDL